MPAVCDLLGLRGSGTSALGVGAGPVTADDLHLGVGAQPRGQRLGISAGKYVKRSAGLQVDQESGIGIVLAQSEVVDAQDTDSRGTRFQQRAQEIQERVLGDLDLQRRSQTSAGAARQTERDRHEHASQQRRVAGVPAGQPGDLLGERHCLTTGVEASEPAHRQLDHDGRTAQRSVGQPTNVTTTHSPRRHPASRASPWE